MLTKEIWKELRLIDEIVHNTSIVYGEDEITYRWVIDIFLLNFCYLRRKKFVFDANSLWYQMNLTAGLSRQILGVYMNHELRAGYQDTSTFDTIFKF